MKTRTFASVSVIALTLAVAGLVLAGCNNETPPAGNAGPADSAGSSGPNTGKAGANDTPTTGKIFTIGLSQCNLGEPWRVQMNKDIQEAADKHPDKIKLIPKDAQNKSEQQQSQIQEFIQQKVDLIII